MPVAAIIGALTHIKDAEAPNQDSINFYIEDTLEYSDLAIVNRMRLKWKDGWAITAILLIIGIDVQPLSYGEKLIKTSF